MRGTRASGSAARRRGQRRFRSFWRHEQQAVARAVAAVCHHSAERPVLRNAPRRQSTAIVGGRRLAAFKEPRPPQLVGTATSYVAASGPQAQLLVIERWLNVLISKHWAAMAALDSHEASGPPSGPKRRKRKKRRRRWRWRLSLCLVRCSSLPLTPSTARCSHLEYGHFFYVPLFSVCCESSEACGRIPFFTFHSGTACGRSRALGSPVFLFLPCAQAKGWPFPLGQGPEEGGWRRDVLVHRYRSGARCLPLPPPPPP